MAHAPFPPSSADRWTTCRGSFGLSLHLPDPGSSSYADEGTRLHDVAANILQGTAAEYTAADMAFLEPYIKHCMALRVNARWAQIETRLHHSPVLFGTPDFVALDHEELLHVVDLKTGFGTPVSPERNAQLMTYAYMVLKDTGHFYKGLKTVRLTIVQPPDEEQPVKHWDCATTAIYAWGTVVEEAIADALGGATELVPGEHCRWCRAKPICPKLLGTVTEALPIPVKDLTPAALSSWLDKADLMQQWLDALRLTAHELAQRGHEIPGWTLKPKRAMRVWKDPEKTLAWARRNRYMTEMTESKLLSPAQVEKQHKDLYGRIDDQVVAVSSGTNLVRGDNAAPVAIAQPPLAASLAMLKYRT
jgi:hypothetical protein